VVFQSFAASDGEVVIAAANDRLFAKLAKVLGFPEWADDPRFATNALRVEHKAAIVPAIAAVIATRPMAHWIDQLEVVGVPCAPINDLQQVVDQPQTAAIGILQEIPEVELKVVGLPVSFDGQRPPVVHRAPEIGEHTAAIRYPEA
jgi:crotonobetainyl-CoA:carnitine CoA-transferase CaiB-like acyl-CoA transferase